MCRAATEGRRRCSSSVSYEAAARMNKNRRLCRLARRSVAEFLLADGLPETAAAVLSAPPSILRTLMVALGIDEGVLGNVRVPSDRHTRVSAGSIIALAHAERANRLAQAGRRKSARRAGRSAITSVEHDDARSGRKTKRALSTTVASLEIAVCRHAGGGESTKTSPVYLENNPGVGTAGPRIDARRLAVGSTSTPSRRLPSTPYTASDAHKGPSGNRVDWGISGGQLLNCRARPEVISKWERSAEAIFLHGSRPQARAALAEAFQFCRDCPLAHQCAKTAKSQGYTGLAGGRIFVDGRNRSKPSRPRRVLHHPSSGDRV